MGRWGDAESENVMVVKVRLFAMVRERVGLSELKLELTEGATVGQALAELDERYPVMSETAGRVAYAVNLCYAQAGTVLKDGDELAVIPPVSGG